MGLGDRRASFRALQRAAIAMAAAALLSGCFQPLYGTTGIAGTGSGVREALAAVDVAQIDAPAATDEARLAVQIRNDLLFGFTGGGGTSARTHRLTVKIASSRAVISVIPTTGLPSEETYTLNATYSLTEIATGKVVVTGRTSTSVGFDTIGTQRFARIGAMKDAERRVAKVIADNITTRLASYFISGS
jgi:LPS-assembly lipoprotein